MIQGQVNSNREAIIQVSILDSQGLAKAIEAVIDTGFNGFLTLPLALVEELGLEFQGHGHSTLANGQEETFKLFAARVTLDEAMREIVVDAADIVPLVGMALLEGYTLQIQVKTGGTVSLAPLDD